MPVQLGDQFLDDRDRLCQGIASLGQQLPCDPRLIQVGLQSGRPRLEFVDDLLQTPACTGHGVCGSVDRHPHPAGPVCGCVDG